MEKHAYAMILSDIVGLMFIKIVTDVIAICNPYLVNSVNLAFTRRCYSGLFTMTLLLATSR